MTKYSQKTPLWALVAVLSLLVLACGSSHRLAEYTFRGLTGVVLLSAPPRPWVFRPAGWKDADLEDFTGTAVRAVTGMAKTITAELAQARLDSAMTQVDVPERIRERFLQSCSRYLHVRPIDDQDAADLLFDLMVANYGIDAESWDGGVYFLIDLEVVLLDNRTGEDIWKTRVKERRQLSGVIFQTDSQAAGDVLSAIALSQLSVEEMVTGFQYLADETAEHVATRLRRDYTTSRKHR